MKNPIYGICTAALDGLPLVVDIFKRLKKKKVSKLDELKSKSVEELSTIVQQHETKDNEHWTMFLAKSVVTLGSVWLVLYLTKQFGISREDILQLFGLLK